MQSRFLRVLYLCLILAGGLLAALAMARQPGEPNPVAFMVLLFLACGTAALKVRLPGVDRSVSLSFAFAFAAITELPAAHAFFVVAVSLLYGAFQEGKHGWKSLDLAFDLGSAAVSTLCTSEVYAHLGRDFESERLISMGAAAVVYYVLTSAASAVQIGFQTRTRPWKVWQEKFFWMGPLYLLVPVANGIVKMLRQAAWVPHRLLGLALIFGGYRYVKHCFGRLHDQQDHAKRLDLIRQRTIEALAVDIEAKDGAAAGHLQRVRRHALRLAAKLHCSETEMKTLEMAALLHDVGNVSVPDYILGKPGRLTEQEFLQVAAHAAVGAGIVTAAQFPYPVEEIVMHRHEHWDGSGYPRQLVKNQIPKLARLLAIVDCFDALVMDRPCRTALPVKQAVRIMREQRGKLFDPQILDAFLEDLPAFVNDLELELKGERARNLLDRSPVQKVRQTWLSDAEANDSVLRRITFEKLASAPERLISLYDILHVLGSSLNTQQTIKQALAALRRVIPYDQAGVFLLEGDHYSLVQGEGIPDYCISRFPLSAVRGPLASAAAARMPLLLPGAPVELAAGLNQHLANARGSLVAPLVEEEAIVGGMMLCASSPDRFTLDHAWFLGLITPKLAATLRCARDVQALREEAATDPITRLPNARAAFQRMEEEIGRAARENRQLAVLFLDLNHFKQVNDTYGHVVGDKVLAETAEKLRQSLRPYDFLGRVGGDEFLAVLPGIDDENLRAKVASLKDLIERNVVVAGEGVEVSTSVSVGVACFPRDGKDAEELMFRSDQRMYEDKRRISPAPPNPAPAPAWAALSSFERQFRNQSAG